MSSTITTHAVLLTALAYASTPAARRAVWDRTAPHVVRAASALLLSDARWGAYGPSTVRELRGWATSARAAVKRLNDDPCDCPACRVTMNDSDATDATEAEWNAQDAACRADGCLDTTGPTPHRHTDACTARLDAMLDAVAARNGHPAPAVEIVDAPDDDDMLTVAVAVGSAPAVRPAPLSPLDAALRAIADDVRHEVPDASDDDVTALLADVTYDGMPLGDDDECPACGEHRDYCQGHGPIGDPDGYAVLAALGLVPDAPAEDDPYVAQGPEHDDCRGIPAAVAFLVTMVVGIVVLWALGFSAHDRALSSGLSAPAADMFATVQEDSPRWDCYADGNRLCAAFHGPTR